MIIRFAEEKDIEQINKLLVQVNSIHHRGRPDLFKSGKKKYTDEELRKIIKDNIYVFQSSAFGIIPMITNPGTYICRLSYIGLSLFVILDNIYNRPSIFEGSFYFRKMFLLKGTF